MAAHRKTETEFWSKVAVAGVDECWPYLGDVTPNGYGRLRWANGKTSAHRLSYVLTNGVIPDGLVVCHTCDNKPCCNPKHLYAGTNKQNSQDASARGLLKGVNPKGIRNGNSKLSEEDVRYIKWNCLKEYGSVVRFAKRFGVTDGTIRAILKDRAWKHLEARSEGT